ncbi:aspartyl protease family protein [Botrimarina hoheduenensis]|uniref:Peptidase A2 domain-containing protein n=1 Tax=Botrimarina hoheduenensis TaxID=2528000 RepID=A0A5C5VWP1_9BACT|nr:aspartyl protease family protein [Botrimarina hoheduenensis]TWT42944.1 hypothetical protein Pla111_25820 [Botrimarina hoheduenensis]
MFVSRPAHPIVRTLPLVACGWMLCCSFLTAQVPIDGYLPMVGIALTNEYDDNFNFFPTAKIGTGSATLLGAGGTPRYDIALLDTGAGFSLLTSQAFDDFGLGDPSPGEPDGYQGTEFVTIGGATGQLDAPINDPFGLYVGGLQNRTGQGAALTMNNAALRGQTNTATIKFPPESPLPNVVGLPFASQYATRIRNDLPQVFELNGKTIRTPSIDFQPLGSGGGTITRKAPLSLNPGATFVQPPAYLPNIVNFDLDNPQEDPSTPTLSSGGLFLNVNASNSGTSLGQKQFFFDTGASVTVVSQLNALLLGFDVTIDEPEFSISIVGSGGLAENVPGFFVDQITLVALGGSITATNVPVIVLDVTDPSDPGNIVEGIVGTNLLARRNVVIDPNPSTGGGGASPGVYISDPVTTNFTWVSASSAAPWSAGGSWNAAATPNYLSVTRVEHVAGGDQRAVVTGQQQASEIFAKGGTAGQRMTIAIGAGAKLTTFSGTTLETGAVIELTNGVLDTQYLDIRGGRLEGTGLVRTGSGPIDGQVEVIAGIIAPGAAGAGVLTLEGRYAHGENALLEIGLGGVTAGTEYDQLLIDGSAVLRGDLAVSLINAGAGLFAPSIGDRFEILTYEQRGGVFSSLTLPTGYLWDVQYTPTALVLEVSGLAIPGDFNADGQVDIADYTTWRDGLGSVYSQADYQIWKNNFGMMSPANANSVPEPSLAILLLIGIASLTAMGSRQRC